MSTRGKRLILVALLVTLMLGATLYFLSQPTPRSVANPLSAAWWDNFEKHYRIKETEGLYRDGGDIYLTHVHDLGGPVPNAADLSNFVLAQDGRLFGTARIHTDDTIHLFVYDPVSNQSTDLGILANHAVIQALAVGQGKHVYAGVTPQDRTEDAWFLIYDTESGQARNLYFPFLGRYPYALIVAPDSRVYGAIGPHLFCYDPATDRIADLGMPVGESKHTRIMELVLSTDGKLYGLGGDWKHKLFEYDLATSKVTLLAEKLQWDGGSELVLSADNKLYGVPGLNLDDRMFSYDLTQYTLTDLGNHTCWRLVGEMASGPDGGVYGIAGYEATLCRYDSINNTSVRLEILDDRTGGFAVSTDGRVYLSRPGDSIYVPSRAPAMTPFRRFAETLRRKVKRWAPDWARPLLPTLRSGTESSYRYQPAHLLIYEPDAYTDQGTVTSRPIQPHTLMITHTKVRDANLISALAWGGDGALYGAMSRAWRPSGGLLVRYDPTRLERVATVGLPMLSNCWSCGTSALVADPAGRLVTGAGWLVASVSEDFLITYDPGDDTVITTALSIPDAGTITTLAVGPDGHIYGSTMAGRRSHPAGHSHLFVYNSTDGAVVDLGVPFTDTWNIFSLAVAPDGRVYGGGGPAGVVDSYYYNADHAPGKRVFVYDPNTGTFDMLGTSESSTRRVRSLLAAPDGKVYIGEGFEHGDGNFSVYDPVTGELTALDMPAKGNVVALALGDDGLIYGSATWSYGDSYLFTYDPRYPNRPPALIGAAPKTGITALLPGPGGIMYGAIGQSNSYYYGATELIAFRTNCSSGTVGVWERVTWEADTPRGTDIVVDVLNREGDVLLHNVKNGAPLWAIDPISNTTISLRATLSTRDERVTPVLKSWHVDYVFQCHE